eukprot:7663371-Ditylum_brightwellii.AAC.1
MPPVQLTALFVSTDDKTREALRYVKEKILNAAFIEVGNTVASCQIPEKELLLMASKEVPIDWDAELCYERSVNQPESLFHKQTVAIKVCKDAID